MLTAIENFLDTIRQAIGGLDANILLYAVLGVNLLLGLVLLITAVCAHGKTKKQINFALATGGKSVADPMLNLLPRGAGIITPVAFLLFVFAMLVFGFMPGAYLIPYLGLAVYELFNIISRLIYKGKTKKIKKLYALYAEEFAESGEAAPAHEVKHEQNHEQKQEHKYEQKQDIHEPRQEEKAEATPEPEKAEQSEPMTGPTVILTPPEKQAAEPKAEHDNGAAHQNAEEQPAHTPASETQEEKGYQPFEAKRPVVQTSDFNIERAPTYQVPRPPQNPPVVELPKQEEEKPAPKAARPLPANTSDYTVDDILERINQIKRDGANGQTMKELIYTIQKEREKNENKTPEQRQKLSEALSELLKAMNKAR